MLQEHKHSSLSVILHTLVSQIKPASLTWMLFLAIRRFAIHRFDIESIFAWSLILSKRETPKAKKWDQNAQQILGRLHLALHKMKFYVQTKVTMKNISSCFSLFIDGREPKYGDSLIPKVRTPLSHSSHISSIFD